MGDLNRTQRALALWREGKTAYVAAKEVGLSPTALYAAIKREEAKAQRAACPCCGHLLKPGVEPLDPVQAYKDRLLELLVTSAERADEHGKRWLTTIAERVKTMR